MSHWNSGPDRTEDLRHSDPMTPEQEEREALERLYYREYRQEMTRGWQKRLAILLLLGGALCAVGVWLVLR